MKRYILKRILAGIVVVLVSVCINFVLAALIWYPFFKAYEKQKLEEEAVAEA